MSDRRDAPRARCYFSGRCALRRRKDGHVAPHHPQRVRDELRHPSGARSLAASGQPRRRVQPTRVLDRTRATARARRVPRDLPGRCAGRLRRVPRLRGARPARRGADPGGRPAAADPGDGRGDEATRLRRHDRLDLRAALLARPHPHDPRPLHGRPCGVERGHLVPQQCGAQPGSRRSDRARRSLWHRRRVPRRDLQVVGRVVGGRRRGARPRSGRVHRPREGAPDRPPRHALRGSRHPPRRAVAAADAGDLPGRRIAARSGVRGAARRGDLHQRSRARADPPHDRQHPGEGCGHRSRSRLGQDPDARDRRRRRDRRAGAGEVRGLPPVRLARGRARAVRRLVGHRPVHARPRRAAHLRRHGCGALRAVDLHEGRSDPAVDAPRHRRLRRDRRDRRRHRGQPRHRRRRTRALDRGGRSRRLQSGLRRDAGHLRGHRRPARARAAPPRPARRRRSRRSHAARAALRKPRRARVAPPPTPTAAPTSAPRAPPTAAPRSFPPPPEEFP